MERASTIHLYTSTPSLTCDGRRESQHVDTDRREENQHVDTNGRRESQHVDTKGGNSNFIINCENQDSNSRPWVLIPCQASCTSQRNQKSELMKRAIQSTYTLQQEHHPVKTAKIRQVMICATHVVGHGRTCSFFERCDTEITVEGHGSASLQQSAYLG
jgi:hypothetical protein